MENKYQEALDTIRSVKIDDVDIGEMIFDITVGDEYSEKIETLQELVEKATPKKPHGIKDENLGCFGGNPLYGKFIIGACPKCGLDVQPGMKYCSCCGQTLNWGDWGDE